MTQDEVEKKIYDIVLAARTEGIIGGKTKWLAKGDTDDILNIPIDDGVCPRCKGEGRIFGYPPLATLTVIDCTKCNGTGRSKTIRNLIKEYYADS